MEISQFILMGVWMVVWLSISIILAIQTANSYNGMSKDYRTCVFFAKKEIEKGAELTFDYNWSKKRGKGTRCFCGGGNAVVLLKSKQ
jgi:hypothetical protein